MTTSRWPASAERTTFGMLTRSQLMSRVRSQRNKTTELRLVVLLRAAKLGGWRRNIPLPGKPDFVWRCQKVAVFVDGCFWHGCPKHATTPRNNYLLWKTKLMRNAQRDQTVTRTLRKQGWKVLRIWEHELERQRQSRLLRRIARILSARR